MARWAVFDFDGTLLPHTSAEKLFFKRLIRAHIVPPLNLVLFSGMAVWDLLHNNRYALKANKYYLRGLPCGATRRFGSRFFKKEIEPRLSSRGVAEIWQRHRQGYNILVLSGAPEFLLLPLQQQLPIAYLLGSKPAHHKGRFTGALEAPHPFAQRKKTYLLELAPQLDIDFSQSVVFANHHTDALHMELFGEVVAVNPTPRLYQLAQENHWGIAVWE